MTATETTTLTPAQELTALYAVQSRLIRLALTQPEEYRAGLDAEVSQVSDWIADLEREAEAGGLWLE